jgi:hypothetical protein
VERQKINAISSEAVCRIACLRRRWPVTISQSGEYEVTVETSGEADGKFTLEIGGEKLAGKSANTNSYRSYIVTSLGKITLVPGNYLVSVRPVVDHRQPMNLH